MDNSSSCLILLTYKGKVLLMHKQESVIDQEKHPWCFISGVRAKKESFETTLLRRVEFEMGIKIENVEYVSDFCYHAKLTDDNVNKIQRRENQLLDFFSPKELRNLFLSHPTKEFISKHRDLIINPIVS
jgi:NADH pyrophosphatase NudC (nudix superfamily)